jgi:hypothetical protein
MAITPMSILLRAAADHDLLLIVDILHDRFFAISDLTHNKIDGVVRIVFRHTRPGRNLLRRLRNDMPEMVLVIRNVVNMVILDSENVEWYDFNTIDFDATAGILTIKTGIPLLLTCMVSGLDVLLVDPESGSASTT